MNRNKYLELRANARKWKHQDGGIIKAAEGTSIFISTGQDKEDLKRKRYSKEDLDRDINNLSIQDKFDTDLTYNDPFTSITTIHTEPTTSSENWTSRFAITAPAAASPTATSSASASISSARTGVRSDRNNNPLNIRFTNITWEGKKTGNDKTDSDFEEFVSRDYGWRAAYRNINKKITKDGLNSIRKLITSWAPNNENNTEKYIADVSRYTGIDPDAVLTANDANLAKIGAAMAAIEAGRSEIDWDDAQRGFDFYLQNS